MYRCAHFGTVEHVTHNARRQYAFVRLGGTRSATLSLLPALPQR